MTESRTYSAQDDAAMLAAYVDARATFKFFWRELSWEYRRIVPALSLAAIKLPFATDASAVGVPSHEHMWVSDVQFDGDQLSGKLVNKPAWISGLSAGEAVSAPIGELGDWMYVIDGLAYGGHTIDAMRRAMSPAEQIEHDVAWGLDFAELGEVRLVPKPVQERKGGLFDKLVGRKPAQPAAAERDPSEREHPMSESMGPQFDQALRDQPDMVHFRDDAGWTLLQREAQAGNYRPVSLLLKHGADASLRTPSGKSALDLAWQMQWPRIVQLLEGHR
ncbi:DUF2314 domain-containing protein [Xanthomonas floridensis]|uniref:DUF2314 domain-containing protein n=1 Tax=Xanthomonas floridensis TaxID=1843580 RepID=A0A1A9M885_9XANT|nr:DUF2314 domain-containing protein [Xanthomonas floridensis]MEA5123082.1 DUF2314 domain-containing protein [Xanthomonas floridensis]MEA5130892.1 DUF2314 domain-containing protein [Xanthomonas floridensis]OAG66743.1 hypothetical protein A7D17_03120 [Xanthomonas floridensis]